jgi:hypothetical protein
VTDLSWANFVAYNAQILLVVAAAAIGVRLFGVPIARARLTYWRGVLFTCLILPFFPMQTLDVAFVEVPAAMPAAVAGVMESTAVCRSQRPSIEFRFASGCHGCWRSERLRVPPGSARDCSRCGVCERKAGPRG